MSESSEFEFGYPVNPMDRLSGFDGWSYEEKDLLRSYAGIFSQLKPRIKRVDYEGGEHYRLRLTDEQLAGLVEVHTFGDEGIPSGIEITREERQYGSTYFDEGGVVQLNPWGDLILTTRIERGDVATTYQLTMFWETEQEPRAQLDKFVSATDRPQAFVARQALLLAGLSDPLVTDTSINDIDDAEHDEFESLMRDMLTAVS